MAELYRIGIERDGLHRNLGEGFPKGSLVLLKGKNGSGKSVISQRLLYGFLKNGHSTTYISTEFTTKAFIDQMKSLDYNIVDYLLNRELLFIPVYPMIGRVRPREDFLERVMSSRVLYERDITFFDTFSSLIKYNIDEERTIKLISFFKKLAGINKTIIMTFEEGELSPEIMSLLESDVDVLLSLHTRIIEGATTRTLVVDRFMNAGGRIVERTGFRIEPKRGFILDITTVA